LEKLQVGDIRDWVARKIPDLNLDSNGKPNFQPEKTVEIDLEKRGIFNRYKDCEFSTMEARGIPLSINFQYSAIKQYASKLSDHAKKGIGLILAGPVGTMKTSLAVAVLRQHLNAGGGGQFVGMASLLDTIFTLKETNKEEWAAFETRLKDTGLLVIDDLGAEYEKGWVLTKVDAIISERYNRMRPTIITTNLTPTELAGKYAARVIDRLRSTSIFVEFTGDSLRKLGK
jgi:DNA replication protein DnaC